MLRDLVRYSIEARVDRDAWHINKQVEQEELDLLARIVAGEVS